MKILLRAVLLLALLGACTNAAPAQESAEQMIDSLMAAYDEASDDAAKLAVCEDVLQKYPESNYTVPLLGLAKEHSVELGALAEFVQFAEQIRSRVSSQETLDDIDRFMLETYGEAKQLDKLNTLAGRLTKDTEGDFNLYYDLAKAYADVEQWDAVLDYAERARPFATPEAYKNDYPDREMSDEVLEQRARNREGLIHTYAGWAKAQTGQFDAALDEFADADERTDRLYMGHTYGNLDYFWGQTLAMAGKTDQAIGRLAPRAIFGEDDETMAALRDVYIKKNGSEDGFDSFIESMRTKLARPVDDFTLKGYSGEELTLSSFNGKVILLSFWFPT